MTSQADMIALFLESGDELTPLDALEMFGCFRLAARIKDLRERGLPIETLEREANGKRFAAYRIRRPVQRSFFDASTGATVPASQHRRSEHVGLYANTHTPSTPTCAASAVLAGERGGVIRFRVTSDLHPSGE